MLHTKKIIIVVFSFFSSLSFSYAQIDSHYSVGTWYGFKQAAVTYTFDDLTSNQIPVAMPLFDNYGFKMTFNVVTGWGPNWTALKQAANNGHEIGSHTVTHATLNAISVSEQNTELQNSQNVINSNITNTKCVTVAYPNCNIGDKATLQKYYISGRICSNQIEPTTPPDFYNISSIICGSQGSATNAQGLTTRVNSALSSKGWCVFLFHGIDNDGGYSSFASSELSTHLSYMNTNYANYWIGTFAEVSKYIKERNAVSISETTINVDSISVSITDNLDNSIYNTKVSIRRELPSTWEGAFVYLNGNKINSTIDVVNNVSYISFETIPDAGSMYIANSAVKQQVVIPPIPLKFGWNLIAYPYSTNNDIQTALSSIWANVDVIKNEESYYSKSNPTGLNLLTQFNWGRGYFIYVTQPCNLIWNN